MQQIDISSKKESYIKRMDKFEDQIVKLDHNKQCYEATRNALCQEYVMILLT